MHALAKRLVLAFSALSTLVRADIIGQTCGVYSTVDSDNASDLREDIEGRDGCETVGPKSCRRLGCKNTSGFYVCNDQDLEICVPYADAVNIGMVGWWTCLRSGGPYSYQVFTTNEGGYNVVEAYANCNDDEGIPPSGYGPPHDGVNGFPDVQCGAVAMPACESQREMCAVDSVVVTNTPTRGPCDPYMLEQVVNAGHTYTYTKTRSTTQGWSVGGQLGIKLKDADPKFTFSWSESVTTGHNLGANKECGSDLGHNGLPGNWTCGMTIIPQCMRVEGTCEMNVRHAEMPAPVGDPVLGKGEFVTYLPLTDGEGGEYGVQTPQLCTCKDCDGWAEGGAPQIFCQLSCPGCAPKPNAPLDGSQDEGTLIIDECEGQC